MRHPVHRFFTCAMGATLLASCATHDPQTGKADYRALVSSALGVVAKVGEVALGVQQQRVEQKTSSGIAAQQQAEQAQRRSGVQLLENWSPVTTHANNGQPMIEICIRDHECEDGDVLRVSVNGHPVIQREIFNQWSCEAKYVRSGTNSVQIYAVNGTGHKGNCSFSDANTGQIKLSGINSDGTSQSGQIQEWSINSGAGSTSSVEIRVE